MYRLDIELGTFVDKLKRQKNVVCYQDFDLEILIKKF